MDKKNQNVQDENRNVQDRIDFFERNFQPCAEVYDLYDESKEQFINDTFCQLVEKISDMLENDSELIEKANEMDNAIFEYMGKEIEMSQKPDYEIRCGKRIGRRLINFIKEPCIITSNPFRQLPRKLDFSLKYKSNGKLCDMTVAVDLVKREFVFYDKDQA